MAASVSVSVSIAGAGAGAANRRRWCNLSLSAAHHPLLSLSLFLLLLLSSFLAGSETKPRLPSFSSSSFLSPSGPNSSDSQIPQTKGSSSWLKPTEGGREERGGGRCKETEKRNRA